jgi:hypothetical protein
MTAFRFASYDIFDFNVVVVVAIVELIKRDEQYDTIVHPVMLQSVQREAAANDFRVGQDSRRWVRLKADAVTWNAW